MTRSWLLGSLLVISLVPGTACSTAYSELGVVVSSGPSTMEFSSLVDWLSYADLVAEVTVTDEDPGPGRTEPAGLATALLYRDVTVSVDRVLWTRHGKNPKAARFRTDGWLQRDGKLTPISNDEGPRLEVGQRYVIAFIADDDPAPMTASSVLPVEGATIRIGDRSVPAAAGLDGLTLGELAARIQATQPDPLSLKHAHLPATERSGRAQADREATRAEN